MDDLKHRLRTASFIAFDDGGNDYTTAQDALAAIEALEAQVAAADALADWVEGIIEDGCPLCGGDCSSSNPPPTYCPQKDAMRDLAAYNEAKKGPTE